MGIREKLKTSMGRDPTYSELQAAKKQRDASKHQRFEATEHRRFEAADNQPAVDWTCNSCGAHCFASTAACFKCGTGKDGSAPTSKTHKRREGIYKSQTVDAAERRDKTITCKICAAEFVFTAGEQDYFRKQGFVGMERSRCPSCASAKKRKLEDAPEGGGAKPTCGGRLICFDWQKGGCARGDGCRFAHGEADGLLSADDATGEGRSPPKPAAVIKCFHCNAEGHRVADCPKAKAQQQAAAGKKMGAGVKSKPGTPDKKKKKKRNRNGTLPTANRVVA